MIPLRTRCRRPTPGRVAMVDGPAADLLCPTRLAELQLGPPGDRSGSGRTSGGVEGGDRVGYGKLLLATGASPRRLDLPGADLDGICYLRRIEESERLREAIRGGGRVVVVGAGWIGLETGAAARGPRGGVAARR